MEEESFARIGNVIVRSLVCFTNVFVGEMRKTLTLGHRKDAKKELEKFLRHIKNSIADSFRNAVIPSISQNGDAFSMSRFAVRLHENIKQYQRSSRLRFLSEYRIVHALNIELEKEGNGLTTVLAGFTLDCDPPEDGDSWFFFDLKISNFEAVSTKVVRNGREYRDLLELDSLAEFDHPFVNETVYAKAQT